jgi:hypothetical protein
VGWHKKGYPRYTPLNPLLSLQKFHPRTCRDIEQASFACVAKFLMPQLTNSLIMSREHFCTGFLFSLPCRTVPFFPFFPLCYDKSLRCVRVERSCLGRVIGVELPRGNKPITSCCKQHTYVEKLASQSWTCEGVIENARGKKKTRCEIAPVAIQVCNSFKQKAVCSERRQTED